MLAFFSGFNGFGQFVVGADDVCAIKVNTFKNFNLHPALCNKSDGNDYEIIAKLLIEATWSYTAFAYGTQLILSGFLNNKPKSQSSIEFDDNIKEIGVCDRYCLILLNNGKLYKVLLNSVNTVAPQEVKFAIFVQAIKRGIFGDKRNIDNKLTINHIAVNSKIAVAISDENVIYNIPNEIFRLSKNVRVQQLVCGFEHALLLTGNGDIFSWGNGLRGQLGQETLQLLETPKILDALAGIKIICVAAGGWHSAAISSFGDLYTWGYNSNGQLGLRLFKLNARNVKEPSVYPLPQLIENIKCCTNKMGTEDALENSCNPLKIHAGGRHLILLMSCGTLLSTGWNEYEQLGFNLTDEKDVDHFTKIDFGEKICFENTHIYCGDWNTVLVEKKVS